MKIIEAYGVKNIARELLRDGVSKQFAEEMKDGQVELRYPLDDFYYFGNQLQAALDYLNRIFYVNEIHFEQVSVMSGFGSDLVVTSGKRKRIKTPMLTEHTVREALQVSGMLDGNSHVDLTTDYDQLLTQQEFDDMVSDFKSYLQNCPMCGRKLMDRCGFNLKSKKPTI
ncbi:hypothetical protein [Furfurilactobacillus entadae]|uniref:hypothetical protein n=1 Tax=Furfurilactobacillus entadae TaxID=2922307 RepID=UPI0035E869D4